MAAKRTAGRLTTCLLLLAGILALASCSVGAGATARQSPSSADPVVQWIRQHALPLRSVDPGGSDADLAALSQMVGHASVVGLGEETHGTHEFIDVKARLTEYLISNLGFTTFVMENNWGSSQLVDAYINGAAGDITTIMGQSLFGSWQTHEYQALLKWMRTYNADPAHTTKVHFVGMDCQAVSQNDFDDVTQYVQQVDPQQVASVHSLYAPIIAASLPNPYRVYVGLDAATKQKYQNQAQAAYEFLQAHQQSYTQRSSAQRFAFALQNARVIAQFTTYADASTEQEAVSRYYQRDGFMAENVEWIHDHAAGAAPKMIVWAHDVHIANDTTYPSEDGSNMGGVLRAHFADAYVPIGTTLYQGTFRIYEYPTGVVQAIAPAPADTYNFTLGQAGLPPVYLLDLRTVPAGAVADWARGAGTARRLLTFGLGGEDLSSAANLGQWFDVIVHVQTSTPSQHL